MNAGQIFDTFCLIQRHRFSIFCIILFPYGQSSLFNSLTTHHYRFGSLKLCTLTSLRSTITHKIIVVLTPMRYRSLALYSVRFMLLCNAPHKVHVFFATSYALSYPISLVFLVGIMESWKDNGYYYSLDKQINCWRHSCTIPPNYTLSNGVE